MIFSFSSQYLKGNNLIFFNFSIFVIFFLVFSTHLVLSSVPQYKFILRVKMLKRKLLNYRCYHKLEE